MKLTDYVTQFLHEKGIRHVFGLTGGAVVHLFDSAQRGGIQPIFNHHEQAGAFAAEAYAKIHGLGLCYTTTGPGATNAITGLAGAWLDSVPCFFISGQARYSHTTEKLPIRQLGTQQIHLIPIVQSMTKYAVMLDDAKKIRFHLEKAFHLATTGRPGPVWIDIPLDFQWANIEPETLESYTPEVSLVPRDWEEQLVQVKEWISQSQRPLVLLGSGCRLAGIGEAIEARLHRWGVPFTATWGAADLIPTDDPLNVGRAGLAGQRGANLAIQNCDLLLALGTHLPIPLTGQLYPAFARAAKVVVVDVDKDELDFDTVRVDMKVQCDVGEWVRALPEMPEGVTSETWAPWRAQCEEYAVYNRVPDAWREQKEFVNQYVFVDALSDRLREGEPVVVDGGGTNVYVSFQALRLKRDQRLILSTGLCSMGSGFPEAIGACYASGKRRTICLCGDGSFQLNVQELQTIVHHALPIKIIVFNNGGYVSIRQTQAGFLEGRFIGSAPEGGMSLPDIRKVAEAYGLPTLRVENHAEIPQALDRIFEAPGPILCEVMVPASQEIVPTQGFEKQPNGTFAPRPLEDMAPFLDRATFHRLMIVEPWKPGGQ